MYTHKAYGLCFHSDIELTGLPECEEAPDIVIRLKTMDETVLGSQPNWGERIFGHIHNSLFFLVEGGRSITVDVRGDIEEADVRTYIQGVLMAILLRQRGLLVLHACCVARSGEAIAFVGESGWGKSTLAEFFCQNGFSLVNDDILALHVGREAPVMVMPGYPQIRLRADSGAQLHHNFKALPRINSKSSKRIRSVEDFRDTALPLSRVILLERVYQRANVFHPLNPAEAIGRLMAHTRVKHLFDYPTYKTQNLQHCVDLIRHVPVLQLQRVRSLDALPEIFSLVTHELKENHASQAA